MKWGRAALVLATVALAALIAAPAAAYGKTATRIVVTKTKYTVDWSTPGVIPTAPVVTAKLQKKSGSHWVTLRGTIRVYMIDSAHTSYTKLYSKSSVSYVKQTLGTRGKYKFYYAGSSTMKACAAYSTRVDKIGDTIERVGYSIHQIDDTWTSVSVTYRTNWNTEAFPNLDVDFPLEVAFTGTFENAELYSGYVSFYQQVWEPNECAVQYQVLTADIPLTDCLFDTTGKILSDDDYVVTSAVLDRSDAYSVR